MPLLASGALGFLVVYRGLHSKEGIEGAELPAAAVLLCLSAAFVLDDPAASSVAGTPTPLLLRRAIRIGVSLPLLIAIWTGVVAYSGQDQIAWAMWVEFAGMVTLTGALAAIGARLVGEERGGVFASPVLLFLLAGSRVLSDRWRPFPLDLVGPSWFDAYGRWLIALGVSLILFLVVGREPARPNRVRLFLAGTSRKSDRPSPKPHPTPEGVPR